jgi:hypothetical protein
MLNAAPSLSPSGTGQRKARYEPQNRTGRQCEVYFLIRLSRLILISIVLASSLMLEAPTRRATPAAAAPPSYAGWAMVAYPHLSGDDLRASFARMRDGGANLIWLGHSNPATVDPRADEIGLSYPVFVAATNPASPIHSDALTIVSAQKRALDAARVTGLKVVLPLGYRTQMGAEWSAAHRDSLRRGPTGDILDFGGLDASPYAGDFRSDMERYYRWAHENFVSPYRDVILMLNLADEPAGVDYSSAAESTFLARYGYRFRDVGVDQRRVAELGEFQSRVMVDFAVWAAQQWLAIDPGMPVTMSFDGAPGRHHHQAPAIDDIFRDTPPNFQPAWDAYPRDGTSRDALNDSDLASLHLFLGTIGHLSARYDRPFWLWSSGNSWGLGQQSSDPSTIADALVNLRMLANVSRQAGGHLRGIAIWNYNLRGQGLYGANHQTVYIPDDMFTRLTSELPAIRQILEGPAGPGPNALVLAPNALPHRLIGAERLVDIWGFRGYSFGDLVSLARSGATTAVLDTLAGQDMSRIRLLVVLARVDTDLTSADVAAIRAYRASGRELVVSRPVENGHNFGAQWVAPGNAPEVFFADDYTARLVGPVAAFGLPRLANSFTIIGPSEVIAYGGTSFDKAAEMRAWTHLPFRVKVIAYSGAGVRIGESEAGPGLVSLPTQRHAFARIPLVPMSASVTQAERYFGATGFRVENDAIWAYFQARGGIDTFGYPVSRTFQLLGFPVQVFQRHVLQVWPDGSVRPLNLLDPDVMPISSVNFATVPAHNPAVATLAPHPDTPGYGQAVQRHLQATVPDTWEGQPVGFLRAFLGAAPVGSADFAPLVALEILGFPTSQPARDPNNHNFVYQRFQRGILHYDATTGVTRGLLLADAFKAVLTGRNMPSDLAAQMAQSRFFGQYDPAQPNWVRDSGVLPGTNLTGAFVAE